MNFTFHMLPRPRTYLPYVIPALSLAAWIIVSHYELIAPYLLPSPGVILQSGAAYIFSEPGSAPFAGRFLSDAGASCMRVAYGFSCAVAIGLPLGLMSGRLATVKGLLSLTVNAVRAIPGITWLPLAMAWLGIGTRTTVFLVAMAAFFPIYLNTAAGAAHVNPILIQAGSMMGVRGAQSVWRIIIPASMPHIVTGLRLGLGLSWAYLALGELTGVPNGLGAVIMDARMMGRVDIIIVGMIVIAIIGKLSDTALVSALRFSMKSVRRMDRTA